jgi:hypothetical protein
MADLLDVEITSHNTDTIIVRPSIFRANTTTGLGETVPLTGRTDGVAFLSLTEDTGTAIAIATLSVALVEVEATGSYAATIQGSTKATALANTPQGTVLYRHFQFGSDYRRSVPVIWQRSRR